MLQSKCKNDTVSCTKNKSRIKVEIIFFIFYCVNAKSNKSSKPYFLFVNNFVSHPKYMFSMQPLNTRDRFVL